MRFFYCYSKKLKNELLNNNFKYLHKGVHDKTHKTFWVFVGDEELNNYLDDRRSR